jgi:hypothetical protein
MSFHKAGNVAALGELSSTEFAKENVRNSRVYAPTVPSFFLQLTVGCL